MKPGKPPLPITGGLIWITVCLILNSLTVSAQHRPQPAGNEAIAILTRYDVKQAYHRQFRDALHDYVTQAITMKYSIMAEAYAEQEDPSIFWVIERWDSRQAFHKAAKSKQAKSLSLLMKHVLQHPVTTIYVKDLEPISRQQWRRTAQEGDQPLVIMLFVDAKPGTEMRFKEVYHTAMPQFRGEAGVINYQLSQLEEDSTRFVTYEKFKNEAAFQYHLNFPPIRPVLDYLNTSIKKQPFQSGLHKLISITPFGGQ